MVRAFDSQLILLSEPVRFTGEQIRARAKITHSTSEQGESH